MAREHRVRVPSAKKVSSGQTFVGASLEVRYDSLTERWAVFLVSNAAGFVDVPVAWKAEERDALLWASRFGVRS